MAVYIKLIIERTVKVQDPLPDNLCETFEDETTAEYPFDAEEIDGSVTATIVDAD
jgi:hypothetical protein